jgi:hypothetical protein
MQIPLPFLFSFRWFSISLSLSFRPRRAPFLIDNSCQQDLTISDVRSLHSATLRRSIP